MVYIHSPVGNNLNTIPGTNGVRRGRIAIGLGRKRKHQDVYFCPSYGRDMIYLKQVPCFFCTHCSFTQYMDNVVRKDKPAFEVTDSSVAYVGNLQIQLERPGLRAVKTRGVIAHLTNKAC